MPGWEQSSIDNNNYLDVVDESQSGETLIGSDISTTATSVTTTPLIDNSLDELDKELGLSIPGIPVIASNAKSVSFVMSNKRMNADIDGCEYEIIGGAHEHEFITLKILNNYQMISIPCFVRV